MNMMERNDGLAVLTYGDNEFVVMRPGRFVLCAVTGQRIPLEVLRYWSTARQEPYAGPEQASRALAGAR